MSAVLEKITGRSLVAQELFDRLVNRVIKDHSIDTATAEQVMDQALAFLKACADNPTLALRPSRMVDLGWHTFILDTLAYAEFCQQVAGRFLHHVPEEFTPPAAHARAMLAPTLNAMTTSGLVVDGEMWSRDAGACTQCHGGCTHCGQTDPDPGHH